jgi:molecular chaperone HscB
VQPFETLGLPARFDLSLSEIEQRYRDLQKALHPDRFAQASPTERRMSLSKAVEVNEAYRVLRDDLSRAEALLMLRGWTKEQGEKERADPELLMEMMELREELGEARRAKAMDRVQALAGKVTAMQKRTLDELGRALDASHELSPSLVAALGRLRYYRRFLDEVRAIEDEAS